MRKSTLSRIQVFEWKKAFPKGLEVLKSVNDDNMEKVKEIMFGRLVGFRGIAEDLNISYRSVQHILVNALYMKRGYASLVQNP